jgi:predicted metal-dependent hydrolase
MNLYEISPHLRLKISPRARRMALRLDTHARVVQLVVPKRASLDSAYDFARHNQSWIETHIGNLPKQIRFTDGAVLPLFGKDITIHIHYRKELKNTTITLKKHTLSVYTNKRDPSARIRRFLAGLAEEKITKMAARKAAKINKEITSIKIRDTKSRWGSCSEDRKLSFCWRLIFAPPDAMDYVIAHEVAHLRHMDHGPAFWALTRKLSKNYEIGYVWMQTHGHELMRYGQTKAQQAAEQ